VQRDQLRGLVQEGIDRLPDSYREVLIMRDIEELDTEEVAEALGVSTNAVKTRLHRARQALRQVLDPSLREDA
jgi:RNA polymerase sigma-70 factor (ECF subfamily)